MSERSLVMGDRRSRGRETLSREIQRGWGGTEGFKCGWALGVRAADTKY